MTRLPLLAALVAVLALAACAVPDGPGEPADPLHASLLANGFFDDGRAAPWTQSSAGGYPLITGPTRLPFPAHSGGYAAWLGGSLGALDVLSQDVVVPEGAAGATLEFFVRIRTEHGPASPEVDVLTVALEDAAGATLHAFARLTNRDATDQWERVTVDLADAAALIGVPARLVFRETGDTTGLTSFFVDTVSLIATINPAE
jgi:hypothetical protein